MGVFSKEVSPFITKNRDPWLRVFLTCGSYLHSLQLGTIEAVAVKYSSCWSSFQSSSFVLAQTVSYVAFILILINRFDPVNKLILLKYISSLWINQLFQFQQLTAMPAWQIRWSKNILKSFQWKHLYFHDWIVTRARWISKLLKIKTGPFLKMANLLSFFRRFYSYMGEKLKLPWYKGGWPQNKKCKKTN